MDGDGDKLVPRTREQTTESGRQKSSHGASGFFAVSCQGVLMWLESAQ